MDPVLGIDLGTTNSCVAVVVDGAPRVIANKGGYRTTPSMVAFSPDGQRLVGHLAKRQAVTNAQSTIFGAKRLIGRRFESDVVQQMKDQVPYLITKDPNGEVRIQLGERFYSLPEISVGAMRQAGTLIPMTRRTSLAKGTELDPVIAG